MLAEENKYLLLDEDDLEEIEEKIENGERKKIVENPEENEDETDEDEDEEEEEDGEESDKDKVGWDTNEEEEEA
jgi:hypothetical protein